MKHDLPSRPNRFMSEHVIQAKSPSRGILFGCSSSTKSSRTQVSSIFLLCHRLHIDVQSLCLLPNGHKMAATAPDITSSQNHIQGKKREKKIDCSVCSSVTHQEAKYFSEPSPIPFYSQQISSGASLVRTPSHVHSILLGKLVRQVCG